MDCWRITFRFGYQAGEGPQWQRNSKVERIWEEKSPRSMRAIFLIQQILTGTSSVPGLCWGNTKINKSRLLPLKGSQIWAVSLHV